VVGLFKPDLAESVTGALGGEMKLSGAGTLPDTVKKKLTGNGVFRLVDGKLQSIPALDAAAALMKVGELREIVIDDGSVRFTIKDGQVTIDSKMTGPTTRLTTSGQVGLDGLLNLRSALALSPELGGNLREQGTLSRYLGDEKGWTTVPLRIKGSYDSPDVGLDSKGLKKQAEKTVKKEVQKSIEKELQRGLQKLFGN
jgi:AsmA protein